MALKEGDKYLTIRMVGHTDVAVFKNENKDKDTDPDYRANGVAVWVNEKKAADNGNIKPKEV